MNRVYLSYGVCPVFFHHDYGIPFNSTDHKVDTDRCKTCLTINIAVAVINQAIIAITVMPLMSSVVALKVGDRTIHESPDLAWQYGHNY